MNPSSDITSEHCCTCLEQERKVNSNCPIHGIQADPSVSETLNSPDSGMSLPRSGVIKYASSAAFQIYGQRPPIGETHQLHESLLAMSVRRAAQISPLMTLFPAETITRSKAPVFRGGDAEWQAKNTAEYYRSINYNNIPCCTLSMIQNVTVQNAAIYFDGDHDCTMLYEMHRPNDRPTTIGDLDISVRTKINFECRGMNKAYLFIASAGSHNWGHWLTDDLPRVAAAAFLREYMPNYEVTILLLSFGPAIDAARLRSIECHAQLSGVAVQFLERFVAYKFDELFYASPVSFHPVFKLRGAIQYVQNSYSREHVDAKRKLYVTRPNGNVRSLANAEEVETFMRQAGFEIVECTDMSFDEQVQLFSEASTIVGIMGAAMTNTIFSQPDTYVVHLACIDWIEPFYWDLADACDQRCCYVFGPSVEPDKPPHFARFAIPLTELVEALNTTK